VVIHKLLRKRVTYGHEPVRVIDVIPDECGLHGAYRRDELEEILGLNRVRSLLGAGALRQFAQGVVVETQRAESLHTRAAAAQLFAGENAVLSDFTALSLMGCAVAPLGPVRVLVPY